MESYRIKYSSSRGWGNQPTGVSLYGLSRIYAAGPVTSRPFKNKTSRAFSKHWCGDFFSEALVSKGL